MKKLNLFFVIGIVILVLVSILIYNYFTSFTLIDYSHVQYCWAEFIYYCGQWSKYNYTYSPYDSFKDYSKECIDVTEINDTVEGCKNILES